jgi:hypothetical protein
MWANPADIQYFTSIYPKTENEGDYISFDAALLLKGRIELEGECQSLDS